MSFILDALKKSESDRQQHGPAEFAGVPTSNGRQSTPRWLWILGALLAVNLVVLLGLLLKPEVAGNPVVNEPAAVGTNAFAEQVAEAKQNVPPRGESRPVSQQPVPAQSSAPAPSITAPAPAPARTRARVSNSAALPTIHEVLADGRVTLPALHVDIHVYGESPKDRFVFINMNKQVEGSKLAEGPTVEEITTDGVVLNYNGVSFVLPRD